MKLFVSATVLFLMTSCSWPLVWEVSKAAYENYPSDNPAEEWLEDRLKDHTEWEVDFSPFTPEKK